MEIKSLERTNFDTIFIAFRRAFADYDIQLNHHELKNMLKRRGFTPELSFAAFEGDDIVAFTLNGTGNFNGKPMAYDTGTGTVKEYRGQGLATKIFEHSIPFLKKENIGHYLLEVLQHNTKAVSIYQKINFKTTREFNYFFWKNETFRHAIKVTPFRVQAINIDEYDNLSDFWDFYPSWQNSFESIQRAREDFICLGAFADEKLIGYCIFEPNSGDITQLAVDKAHRRKGAASQLLFEANKHNKCSTTKLINADTACSSIVDFLKAKNIEVTGKQFEMIKEI
ncbi:GNAT family N-acetyltransferase [Thermophagus xiamenensis]|uniref:Ribosomal protein S18 acetylase RimI n=1 Tax=Thermophagus xiamenensis TaxID=385682 RepID=A0A1I1VYA4_9BACT|nr:GNAT family N-acetyltransferase [Thermophagus xiamenensis]SFD85590.1 Ribosomal protein S18 acetylase RimI [Thermophagus xiamenensis]